jgi:colicin import membrane protein
LQAKRDAVKAQKKAEAVQRKQEAALATQEALAAEQEELAQAGEQLLQSQQAEYSSQIRATVERNWLRPNSVPNGLVVKLRVSQIPGGTVTDVFVQKTSGNIAFDQAAVLAVHKSSPLPTPKDSRLFQREVVFDFDPDS